MSIRRLASIKTADEFREHLASVGADLSLDDHVESGHESPLAQPYQGKFGTAANRFAILPMEGWDGTDDGRPTDLTRERWRKFGRSGAGLIWGGEAFAVRPDGRANPHQLMITADISGLRETLLEAHRGSFGPSAVEPIIGLQLTHSGRYARPHAGFEPVVAYRHPHLDPRVGIDSDAPVMTDEKISRLVDDFVAAAVLAWKSGFTFVDVKHCHGYLGHEFLSAFDRPGKYGGSLENRSRFLREVVEGIRAEAPGLHVGVRVSVFDVMPFRAGNDGVGEPSSTSPYPFAFGGDGTGLGIDLAEPSAFLSILESMGIELVCTTASSPYYAPHFTRPAAFPPSDGYRPPEDPCVGVARQIHATAWLKDRHPSLAIVGSGYSYLQEWLPNVAQRVVRDGGADFIGLGRMVLAYPELPIDILSGRTLTRKRICRTFSDCTTAPRNGMVSGCYPLDPLYKARPERARVVQLKQDLADRLSDDAH